MFTGLIEDLGVLKGNVKGSKSARLTIKTMLNADEISIGDSIAINGVCLTVVSKEANTIAFDVMHETIKNSNLEKLIPGQLLNLERALRVTDRLDGHLVTGHIDGIGVIKDLKKEDISEIFTIETSQDILKYIVRKGSVAVDGISLTVADIIDNNAFSVSVIPHTKRNTTFKTLKIGSSINLEVDILAKYVEKFILKMESQDKDDAIYKKLIDNGFI